MSITKTGLPFLMVSEETRACGPSKNRIEEEDEEIFLLEEDNDRFFQVPIDCETELPNAMKGRDLRSFSVFLQSDHATSTSRSSSHGDSVLVMLHSAKRT